MVINHKVHCEPPLFFLISQWRAWAQCNKERGLHQAVFRVK